MEWYDPNITLSHNCFVNMIMGNRNIGKTYGWTKKLIEEYIKNNFEFIYIRRYFDQLERVMPTFFDDIIVHEEFPDLKLSTKGMYFFINDTKIGEAIPLSKAQNYKSSSFPKVKFMLLEEFLIDGGKTSYIKNEVSLLESLMNTIFRQRIIDQPQNCKVVMLANNVTFMNPYFLEWKMQVDGSKRFQKYKDNTILLQLEHNKSVANAMNDSPYGKLIKDTAYGDYAINNISLYDRNTFIENRTKNSSYAFTFIYKDLTCGVWLDMTQGKMYVSEKYDPYCKMVYAFTASDHSPNTILLSNFKKSHYLKMFSECFNNGALRFETQQLKNITYDILNMTK